MNIVILVVAGLMARLLPSVVARADDPLELFDAGGFETPSQRLVAARCQTIMPGAAPIGTGKSPINAYPQSAPYDQA